MDEKIYFGQRLLDLRKKSKKSQAEIAQLLGITTAAYQNYENGRREAGYATIAKLADFYGVTTDYLLGREPKADPHLDLNLKKADEDEMLKKYMSLPENVRAMLLKVMKELVGEGEDDDEQLAEELAKTRQTAVSGELLEQWEREQQAPEKDTG